MLYRTTNYILNVKIKFLYTIFILALFILVLDVFLFFIFRTIILIDDKDFYKILIEEYNYYKYKTFSPQKVYSTLVLAPVIETFINYQIPFYLMKKINIRPTIVVHLIGIIFSVTHIIRYDAIVYICIYFGAVMWAWAWLIIEKWPPEERVLNPFMSITLMHATLNGLVLGITPLLRWLG